jgi:acetate kinase
LTFSSLVFHYASDVGKPAQSSTKGLHISKAEKILNNLSGWKALTGTSNFSAITSSPDPRMILAFDILVDRICGYVGSYYVTLEVKVDALVFAGGIGENSRELRERVVKGCACLGFKNDAELNERNIEGTVQDVGAKTARHRTLVCRTNEQFEMARRCATDKRLFE